MTTPPSPPARPDRLLHVLLTHQAPAAVAAMQSWWQDEGGVALADQLLVHGGAREDFDGIAHQAKIFRGEDERLRTRDHQRDKQGYGGVFAAVAEWLEREPGFTHVHLAEYDQLPLRRDLGALLLQAMAGEQADVLGFRLLRVDGTSHPHYLYHAADPRFLPHFASGSRRAEKGVVLSMFGSGSLWTRSAFVAVAGTPEPFPIYLELALPSTAHHLGFRVRPFPPEAERWIENLGDRAAEIPAAIAAGGWSIHPVKTKW